jgi:signal transduction histidine kinase
VVKEFADVPALLLDKHRVLQILINLISNAKHAMHGVPDRQRQITLRLHTAQGQAVQIQIADNGEGIPSENLTRIFAHGFTTRKDGHGFGLHSCVLAAREMGGSLTVHSEGTGKGATFMLELPIKIKEEEAQ